MFILAFFIWLQTMCIELSNNFILIQSLSLDNQSVLIVESDGSKTVIETDMFVDIALEADVALFVWENSSTGESYMFSTNTVFLPTVNH